MNLLIKGMTTRQKAIAATATLVIVLLAIVLISLVNFSTTQQKLKQVTEQYQPKMLSAMQLTTHIYHSLSVLSNYLIDKDNYNMDMYNSKVAEIDVTLDELVKLTDENEQSEDAAQLTHWVCDVLDNMGDESVEQRVKQQVIDICKRLPVYK